MLLAKHEGNEDLVSALPGATTVSVQKACSASDEFAAALRDFCEETQASE